MNGELVATLNYGATITNPLDNSVTSFLSKGYGKVTYPLTIPGAIKTTVPNKVCASTILTSVVATADPTASTIVKNVKNLLGSDVCLEVIYSSIASGNSGASLSMLLDVDLLDSTLIDTTSGNTLENAAANAAKIVLNNYSGKVPIKAQINIGKYIAALYRSNTYAAGALPAQRRYLATSDPSSGVIDSNGNFNLGGANNTVAVAVGVTVGVLVVVIAGVIIVIRKRRSAQL